MTQLNIVILKLIKSYLDRIEYAYPYLAHGKKDETKGNIDAYIEIIRELMTHLEADDE